MAMPTKVRPGIPPSEVDAMDITVVAVMCGVGYDAGAKDRAELEEIAQRRAAGEDVSWGGDDFAEFRRRPVDPDTK